MPQLALLFSVLFMALGLGGWLATGSQHMTALIPVGFGLVLMVLGLVARKGDSYRRHAMHGAAMVGLLGFLGTARGLYAALLWMMGTVPERGAAVVSQALMAVLSILWLALCIRSFRQARLKQAAAKAAESPR